jgi:nucleoid-associated protein YgaU
MFASPRYAVRRLVAVSVLVLAFAVGALLAASPSESARVPRHHVVVAGESLWGIASATYGGDPRPHVDAIIDRNHLDGASISPGETLVLP